MRIVTLMTGRVANHMMIVPLMTGSVTDVDPSVLKVNWETGNREGNKLDDN